MSWFRFFVSVLFICVFSSPGYTQEESSGRDTTPIDYAAPSFPIRLDLNQTLLASLGTRGSDYSRPDVRREEKKIEPALQSLDYDFRIRIPIPHLPDYWNEYANRPREVVITQYEGFHGVVYKQIERFAGKYYKRMLRDYWNQLDLQPMALKRRMDDYNLRSSDYGSRWWERRVSFFDSFPVEKGGSRVVYHTIGRKHELFSLGPVHVHNTGKIGWSGWRFSVSAEEDRIITDPADSSFLHSESRRLSFGIKPPRGNIYTGETWTVSGSMKLNLRVDNFANNGSTIKGQIKIIGLRGIRGVPWLNVSLRASVKPFREEYRASIQISLIQW